MLGGTGPLVIAVPGMGDVRGEYRYLTPVLKAAGCRVVTVDLRGFGETSAKWSDYSAPAVGSDLLRLATHLGQTKAIFMGNSFVAGASRAGVAGSRVARSSKTGIIVRPSRIGCRFCWTMEDTVLAVVLGQPFSDDQAARPGRA
jgi:uncharacterized protein (UPF0261 family)